MRLLVTFIAIGLFFKSGLGQNSPMGGFSFSLGFSPNDTICDGTLMVFAAGGGSGITWSWGSSQGINFSPATNSKTVTTTFPSPGTYTVYLMASKNFQYGMAYAVIVVLPNPNVSLNISPKTVCTTQSQIQVTGGSPVGGNYIGPRLMSGDSVLQPGIHVYTYNYIDANGCQASASDSISINVCAGINELKHETEFNIFPNPAINEITFTLQESIEAKLKIYDAMGRIVKEVLISEKHQTISISELENGMYFASMEGTRKWKFIKQ